MPTPLTIGIDASRAARTQRTGTETYALELIKAMARLSDGRHTLRLYSPHPPRHNNWPGGDHLEQQVIPFPRMWTHLRLAAELYHQPPDVLFVPAHVLPLRCPVPAVVTVHDLGHRHYPQAHRPFDRYYLEWSTRRHVRVARHLLADSHATKTDLVNFYGADPDRISVIYLGRNESLAPVTEAGQLAAVRAKYGLPDTYLLYIGTLHPRKNLVRLIDAFAAAHLPQEIALVIAGQKGWLFDEIFGRVEQLGLQQRVLFPGFVAEADKAALLSGARAYVFPSLFEGFGLPVLEAMACGVPVLTSSVSSLPEVAGEAALLVDPRDTGAIAARLGQIATNETLRQRLTAQGFQQILKFSWDAAAAQVLEILEQVCE